MRKLVVMFSVLFTTVYLLSQWILAPHRRPSIDKAEAWVDTVYAELCRKFETK